MIKFSIVVPVHNKEPYLHPTLDSILAQTYQDYELILVNDGSSDNSGNICELYAEVDSRVKVFHGANTGVSAARNRGIKEALCDYIAFIDADDLWEDTYLEETSVLIQKYPEVDIYSSQFGRIINGEKKEPEILICNSDKFITFDLLEVSCKNARLPINASSVVIRKNAIEKVGYFDERIAVFEDYDLFVRLSLVSKVAFINGPPLSFYNLDVPAETKARGKVPPLETNWVSYMSKFDPALQNHHNLRIFLASAKFKQILFYRRHSQYKDKINLIKEGLDKKYLPFKYQVVLGSFIWLSDVYIYLNNMLISKLNKWR